MQKDNKFFMYSILASFILHIVFVNVLPGFKKMQIEKIKKEIVSIPVKVVKLPKKDEKIVKVKKSKNVKKIEVEKSGDKLTKKEPTKQKSMGTEIKFEDDFPSTKIPIEKIDFKEKIKKINWQKDEIKIKKEYSNEKANGNIPELKEIRELEDSKGEEQVPVKISEKMENTLVDEITPKFSELEEFGGIVEAEFPEGVEKLEVEGKGKIGRVKAHKIKYPEIARKNGWEGKVKLKLDIDKKGSIESVSIEKKSLYFPLNDSAKSQMKNWNIQILNNGMQIGGIVMITINFELIKGRD